MHTLHVVGSVSVTVQVRDFQAVIGKEVRQQCLEKIGRQARHPASMCRWRIKRHWSLP